MMSTSILDHELTFQPNLDHTISESLRLLGFGTCANFTNANTIISLYKLQPIKKKGHQTRTKPNFENSFEYVYVNHKPRTSLAASRYKRKRFTGRCSPPPRVHTGFWIMHGRRVDDVALPPRSSRNNFVTSSRGIRCVSGFVTTLGSRKNNHFCSLRPELFRACKYTNESAYGVYRGMISYAWSMHR